MPYDLLTVICSTPAEAAFAAARIGRPSNLCRFFIFVGDKPSQSELAWMHYGDAHLSLPQAEDWGGSPGNAAVRAALLFSDSGAWNMLFCWASDLPTQGEVETARKALADSEEGMINHGAVWGVQREQVVLKGFECAYRDAIQDAISRKPQASGVRSSDILAISEAMAGRPSSPEVVAGALHETAPIRDVKWQVEDSDPFGSFFAMVVAGANEAESDPVLIVLGSNPAKERLEEAQHSIPKSGAVVAVFTSEQCGAIERGAYRLFELETGERVGVFGARS